jgi:hypothetical protein
MLCESAQGSSGKARTIAGGMRKKNRKIKEIDDKKKQTK